MLVANLKRKSQINVQFNGSIAYFIQSSQESYNHKPNIKYIREQMLDQDSAACEVWRTEFSAQIYTTST